MRSDQKPCYVWIIYENENENSNPRHDKGPY